MIHPMHLSEVLDGLYAYDEGVTDSGIHDEQTRTQAKAMLAKMDRAQLARLVRNLYLTEVAIEQGYGLEDAAGFIRWLDDDMGGIIR